MVMPFRILEYQPTPNPNALRCVVAPSPAPAVRSYRKAAEAQGDPLATRLFAVPGVAGILLADGWMTVSKVPDAAWPAIKAGVEQALAQAD